MLIKIDCLERIAENPRNLHPDFGSDVDVIAIEITQTTEKIRIQSGFEVSDIEIADEDQLRPIAVMDQVFIPGYPVLRTPKPNEMPIYKAAFVASEPNIFQRIPSVLIDGKTKQGWSGSPVVRKIPVHKPPESQGVLIRFEQFSLYAIYSGRNEHDPELFSAELGYCWPVRQCLVPILERLTQQA